MAKHQAELARHDAYEQLTYAGVAEDQQRAAGILRNLAASRPSSEEPSPEVKATIVENDPVSAAAAGWMTFQALQQRVSGDPDRYLDTGEAAALRMYGTQILRLVVANRLDGPPFEKALAGFIAELPNQYELAARGAMQDEDALTRLLIEHGLLDNEQNPGT